MTDLFAAAADTPPMLAKSVDALPDTEGWSFEPKWDGFRGIVSVRDGVAQIASRGAKPLTRYFPELTAVLAEQLPDGTVLDGEVVVPVGEPGAQRLDWETLSQRIHPAESRVRMLAASSPASFIGFDALYAAGEDLRARPFAERRAALERIGSSTVAPVHVTRTTLDRDTAAAWLVQFEGAGLDGVIAKRVTDVYQSGKRTMLKIKHKRTADVVLMGYRVHKSGRGVGSLLVGLYSEDGSLYGVGGIAAFSNAKRLELVDELEPQVVRDEDGHAVTGDKERNRFTTSKDTSFVQLRPERVIEVRYDQMEGMRFRHTVQFERWRPDRDAESCTYEQLDRPLAYDLGDVLG